MSSTFRILFYVRRTKLDKAGLSPIIVRITIDGEFLEFSSKIRIRPELWEPGSGKAKGQTKMAVNANIALAKIDNHLRNKYTEVNDKYGYVTPELLKNAFFGVEEKTKTLLFLLDEKIKQKEALSGNSIQKSAVEKYKGTRKRLEEFIPEYCETKDVGIKEVSYDFVIGFDTFLRSKYHCQHNTVVKYLRYLKQITTGALRSGLIRIDPFMDVTLSSKRGYIKYLTEKSSRLI